MNGFAKTALIWKIITFSGIPFFCQSINVEENLHFAISLNWIYLVINLYSCIQCPVLVPIQSRLVRIPLVLVPFVKTVETVRIRTVCALPVLNLPEKSDCFFTNLIFDGRQTCFFVKQSFLEDGGDDPNLQGNKQYKSINHLFQSNLSTQFLQFSSQSFSILLWHILLQHHRHRLHHRLTLLQTKIEKSTDFLNNLDE